MRAIRPLPLAAGVIVLLAAGVWTAREAWPVRALPVAPSIVVATVYEEQADHLRRNETLSHLFARHNIVGQELLALLSVAEGIDPRRVRPDQIYHFRYAAGGDRPDRVRVRLGDDRTLTLQRDSSGAWYGTSKEIRWTVHVEAAHGAIKSSLYETVTDLIPDSILPSEERVRLAWDLADGVYGWVIDFTRDLHPGDEFHVLYERLTSALGDVRFGRILAARVETRGELNTAYVLSAGDGGNQYYDAGGRSLKRAFKLYPVKFRRISSGFSRNRYHPVLRQHRPHLGVDYPAMKGTEITATGDGVVQRAGWWGGYGIVVTLRHPKGVETRYAHMSKLEPGVGRGTRVRQGQRIGFVGSTGLATAPHVHYEFLKNGRHVNPRTAVRFGDGEPLAEARRAEFDSLRARYDRLLESLASQPVAGID